MATSDDDAGSASEEVALVDLSSPPLPATASKPADYVEAPDGSSSSEGDDDDNEELNDMDEDVGATSLSTMLLQPIEDNPVRGLPLHAAHQQLIKETADVLDAHARAAPTWPKLLRTFFRQPSTIAALMVALLNTIFFAIAVNHALTGAAPYQFRATGAFVEAVLVLVILAWNVWLSGAEQLVECNELHDAARVILKDMARCEFTYATETNVPSLLSLSVVQVIRDGVLHRLPATFLVKDDVVRLRYGELAPARIRLLPAEPKAGQPPEPAVELEAGQCLHPSLLPARPWSIYHAPTYDFVCLETPLLQKLAAMLKTQRPTPVMENQRNYLYRVIVDRGMWVLLALSILVNALRTGLLPGCVEDTVHGAGYWSDLLFVLPSTMMLPVLPLIVPTVWIVVSCYANAWLYCLYDAYHASNRGKPAEATADTRSEDGEDSLDEAEFDTPDPESDIYVPNRVIFARSWRMLRNREPAAMSRSSNLLHALGNTTVLCAIDNEGTIIKPFPLPRQVFFLAEQPVTLDVQLLEDDNKRVVFSETDRVRYLSSLKAIGLSLLLNTDAAHTDRPGLYQMQRLRLSDVGRTPIARQLALGYLGRAMGFVDSDIAHFERRREIFVYAPEHAATKSMPPMPAGAGSGSAEGVASPAESIAEPPRAADPAGLGAVGAGERWRPGRFPRGLEIPSMVSVVVDDGSGIQLMTEGHVELVLDYCTHYWNGETPCKLTSKQREKILTFYTSARARDLQCVALAYSPLHLRPDHPLLTTPARALWIHAPPNGPGDVRTPATSPEQELARILAGQTFLGMVVLQHEIKEDIPYLVEALNTAGVHFTYFSRLSERESKQHASQIGLETDWNCCISLANDEADPGDAQDKAQMPRGIDKVRPHLQEVDDIPLHVPIFANCTPSSIQEMIRIYQEYGEVVCCVGSSADPDNACTFATADFGMSFELLNPKLFVTPGTLQRTANAAGADWRALAGNAASPEVPPSPYTAVGDPALPLNSGAATPLQLSRLRSSADGLAGAPSYRASMLKPGSTSRLAAKHHRPIAANRARYESGYGEPDAADNPFLAVRQPAPPISPGGATHGTITRRRGVVGTTAVLPQLHGGGGSGSGGGTSSSVRVVPELELASPSQAYMREQTQQATTGSRPSSEYGGERHSRAPSEADAVVTKPVDPITLAPRAATPPPRLDRPPKAPFIRYDTAESTVEGSPAPLLSRHNSDMAGAAPCGGGGGGDGAAANAPQPPVIPALINAKLNALACSFHIPRDTSPKIIIELIGEARHLYKNVQQAQAYILAVHLSMAALLLLSQLLLMPPVLSGYQVLWVLWIQTPLVAGSFLSSPHQKNLMKQMPPLVKNTAVLAERYYFAFYAVCRLMPVVIICLFVAFATGYYLIQPGSLANLLIMNGLPWNLWDERVQWAVLYSENCVLFVFVLYMVVISSTMLHRTEPVWKFSPLRNTAWVCMALLSIVLQFVFAAISLGTKPDDPALASVSLSNIPAYVYLVTFLLLPAVWLLQEFVKIPDRRRYERFQKRAKLMFNTKLGMHSPV